MKIPFINNSPIKKNLIANLFGIGVHLLNQIVLVPFYVLYWGDELYSDWIVISALTTIFSMSDVGLNNVIQNQFSIKYAEGKIKDCKSLLTNNFILICLTLLVTILGTLVFISFFDITKTMNLHVLTKTEANLVLILLIINVFIVMISSVSDAVYKASHNASISTYISKIGALVVALITLVCILLKIKIIYLCILIIIPNILITIIKYFHSKRYFEYSFNINNFDWVQLKKIIVPSFTFMTFPLSNTIVLQGFSLVVNAYFGAESVVLYNTTRTLCNFIKTLLGTLQTSVWPEYSIAYGMQNYDFMRKLHRKILKTTILSSISLGAFLIAFGPIIFKIWLHDAVKFDYTLMIIYVVVLISESLWISSSVTLMATNRHSKLGILYIISSLLSLCLASIFAIYIQTLWSTVISLIIMHVVICIYAIPQGFILTKDTIKFKMFS